MNTTDKLDYERRADLVKTLGMENEAEFDTMVGQGLPLFIARIIASSALDEKGQSLTLKLLIESVIEHLRAMLIPKEELN